MSQTKITTELTNSPIHNIWAAKPNGGLECFLKAVLDTGSSGNFVSWAVVKRMDLDVEVPDEEENGPFEDASGNEVFPLGKVTLEWSADGSPKTRVTTFLVILGAPFDVIFGADWLFREKILTFNKHLFILQKKPLSKEEKAKNEQEVAAQIAANQRRIVEEDKRKEKEDNEKRKNKKGGAGSSGGPRAT